MKRGAHRNPGAFPNALDPSWLSGLTREQLKSLQNQVEAQLKADSSKQIKCLCCDQSFITKRAWQKFCSRKCRNDYFWKTHEVVEKTHEVTKKEEVALE